MKRASSFRKTPHAQRGMSLIEIMVGLTIGLIIIIAASASLLMVRSSSRTMTDSAALEQQATLAMLQIGRQLSQASAINAFLEGTDPDAGMNGATTAYTPAYTDRPLIRFDLRPTGVSNDRGGIALSMLAVFGQDGAHSDTLSVSYAVPNDGTPANSCAGGSAAPLPLPPGLTSLSTTAARLVSTFAVDKNTHSLVCSQDPFADASVTSPAAANVIEMRVSYLAVDDKGNVTYYKTAKDVSAVSSAHWNALNAVQVCLEMVGDITQAVQPTFKDCQNQNKTVTDGRLHRIVRNTFYLRNPLL